MTLEVSKGLAFPLMALVRVRHMPTPEENKKESMRGSMWLLPERHKSLFKEQIEKVLSANFLESATQFETHRD